MSHVFPNQTGCHGKSVWHFEKLMVSVSLSWRLLVAVGWRNLSDSVKGVADEISLKREFSLAPFPSHAPCS